MIVDIYQQFITLEKGNISLYPQLVEKKEKWKKKQQQQNKQSYTFEVESAYPSRRKYSLRNIESLY